MRTRLFISPMGNRSLCIMESPTTPVDIQPAPKYIFKRILVSMQPAARLAFTILPNMNPLPIPNPIPNCNQLPQSPKPSKIRRPGIRPNLILTNLQLPLRSITNILRNGNPINKRLIPRLPRALPNKLRTPSQTNSHRDVINHPSVIRLESHVLDIEEFG